MSETQTVTAKYNVTNEDGSVTTHTASMDYNFGATVEEAVKLFGAETVLGHHTVYASKRLGDAIRNLLKAGLTEDEIRSQLADWKPGESRSRVKVDPVTALKAQLRKMDPNAAKALMAELKASMAAKS